MTLFVDVSAGQSRLGVVVGDACPSVGSIIICKENAGDCKPADNSHICGHYPFTVDVADWTAKSIALKAQKGQNFIPNAAPTRVPSVISPGKSDNFPTVASRVRDRGVPVPSGDDTEAQSAAVRVVRPSSPLPSRPEANAHPSARPTYIAPATFDVAPSSVPLTVPNSVSVAPPPLVEFPSFAKPSSMIPAGSPLALANAEKALLNEDCGEESESTGADDDDNASLDGCTLQTVNMRWHYSAGGSAGYWSTTKAVEADGDVVFSQQAMEGDLRVTSGQTISVGYSFQMPSNSVPYAVTVKNLQMQFMGVACTSGYPSQSTFTTTLPDRVYTVSD
eukprot:gene21750-24666_t